ncbi:MAG: hypothetical protein RI956_760, partial [Pseudomonadota bacterium]
MTPISSTVKTTDNHLPVSTASDLWLPSLICVVSIVFILSMRWLWFFWRVQQLQNKIKLSRDQSNNVLVTTDSSIQSVDASYHMNKFRNILGVIGDLTAFTAQKNPIILEELIENKHLIVDTTTDTTIIDTTIIDTIADTEKETFLYTSKAVSSEVKLDTTQDEFITTLVPAKVISTLPPFFAHELFHYQARLTWANVVDKEQFLLLLNERAWQQSLPVFVCSDTANNDSVILGWQVIHRHELATIDTLNIFKEWCISLADATHADCKFITTVTWDNFIDEAHSLLAGLDSAIILKI